MLQLPADRGRDQQDPDQSRSGRKGMMSKTLVVITAALAVLVTYLAIQPDRRERAQIMFSEVSAWVQKQF